MSSIALSIMAAILAIGIVIVAACFGVGIFMMLRKLQQKTMEKNL